MTSLSMDGFQCLPCTLSLKKERLNLKLQNNSNGVTYVRAPNMIRENSIDTTCIISSTNPMFDHLLESS